MGDSGAISVLYFGVWRECLIRYRQLVHQKQLGCSSHAAWVYVPHVCSVFLTCFLHIHETSPHISSDNVERLLEHHHLQKAYCRHIAISSFGDEYMLCTRVGQAGTHVYEAYSLWTMCNSRLQVSHEAASDHDSRAEPIQHVSQYQQYRNGITAA
ncbi:hypothetical protein BC835DRAFT_831176 [Cytidiella melzeri]|nr:hypothetical protein BC835DRAFT_831176 [Cytidiella melzeri]